jgi:hypothetical protein
VKVPINTPGGIVTLDCLEYTTRFICPDNEVYIVNIEFNDMLEGFKRLQAGALIQDAFPTLDANAREILISGTGPKAWDKLFPPEETPYSPFEDPIEYHESIADITEEDKIE